MSLPIKMAADLLLNVKDVGKAQRDIENAVGGAATRGLSKAIKTSQKEMKREYSQAYRDMLTLGHKEQARNLKEQYKMAKEQIAEEGRQVMALNKKIAATKDKAQKKLLKEERRVLEANIRRRQGAMRADIQEQAAAQANQLKLLEEGMEAAAERAGKTLGKHAESAADNFTDLVNKGLTLDSLKPDDLLRSLSSGLKDNQANLIGRGKGLMARGAKMGGGMGRAVAGLGKAAAALGGAAVGIAAAVGAIAAVAAVAAAAYGKTKAWNKAILDSISGFDAFNTSAGSVTDSLSNMRTAVSRVSRRFSASGEEIIQMLGAFNQAGLTVGEMKAFTGAGREVTAYTQVLTFAQQQTRAFGMEAGELANLTNRMYEQYGFGLREMREAMESFGSAAQLAGMNSRSFVAAIMEATANMALYNFRLQDTSELLVGLTKLLGEDLAKSTLNMEGTFRNMGLQGRYKAAMTGGSALGDVIDAGATRQLEGAFKDMTRKQLQILREEGILGRQRYDEETGEAILDITDINLDKLGGLTGIQSGTIMNRMAEQGDAMTGFEALTDLAAGIGGGTLARADALDELDRPGEIAATVAQAMGVLDFRDFESMGAGGRMAMEELTGLQGEQLRVMETIFNRVGAQMLAEDPTKYGPGGPRASEIAAAIAGGEGLLTKEEKDALSNDPAKTAADIAQQQLEQLQTIGDVLGTQISGLLNWIGGGVSTMVDGFLGWFGGRSAEDAAIATSAGREKELVDAAMEIQTAIREVERDTNKTDEDKATEIAQLERRLETIDNQREAEAGFQAELAAGGSFAAAGEERLLAMFGGEEGLKAALEQAAQDSMKENGSLWVTNAIDEDSVMAKTLGQDYAQEIATGDFDLEDALSKIQGSQYGDLATLLQGQQVSNDDMLEAEENLQATATAALEAEQQTSEAIVDELTVLQQDEKRNAGKIAGAMERLEDSQREILRYQKITQMADDYSMLREALGDDGDFAGALSRIKTGRTRTGEEGNLDPLTLARLRAYQTGDWTGYEAILRADQFGLQMEPRAHDFIYQGGAYGGTITPISSADSFIGMKPDGVLDRFGGRGRTINMTVNITESNDPQKTLQMVKRAIQAAER